MRFKTAAAGFAIAAALTSVQAVRAGQDFSLNSYTVTANDDFGLIIKTAKVAAEPTSFTLDSVGDSETFALFDIWTDEGDFNFFEDNIPQGISVDLAFNPPAGGDGSVGGQTFAATIFIASGGVVVWDLPAPEFTATNGARYSLALSDEVFNGGFGLNFTPGRAAGATVDLTVTLLEEGANPVPEPGNLLAGALGVSMLAGGYVLRRRRAAA